MVLHRLRTALLAMIVIIGLGVFLVMSALSAAASRSLDDAVRSELGSEGTYRIDLPLDLAIPLSSAEALLGEVIDGLQPAEEVAFIAYRGAKECGTRSDAQEQHQVMMLLRPTLPPDTGSGAVATCAGGFVLRTQPLPSGVPFERVDEADGATATGPASLPMLNDALGVPGSLTWVVVLPVERDQVAAIRDAIRSTFTPVALRAGSDATWVDSVGVRRLDAGSDVRAAGRAVTTTFSAIGWAVLLLAGTAVLVAQLVQGSQRRWHYALLVAVGARRRQIAFLVAGETVVLVAVATAIVLASAGVADAALASWSGETFGARLEIVELGSLSSLVLAAATVTTVGSLIPALKATRADPLESLEESGSA